MAQSPQVGGVITKCWPRLRLSDGDYFPVARDTCAVCGGVYADDVEEETGEVIADWIQCTEEEQCAAGPMLIAWKWKWRQGGWFMLSVY